MYAQLVNWRRPRNTRNPKRKWLKENSKPSYKKRPRREGAFYMMCVWSSKDRLCLVVDDLHDLGLQLLAELGVVLQQRLHSVATLCQLGVTIREP